MSSVNGDLAMDKLPPGVAEKLGYYVYLYVNLFDETIFYVGKGKGNRVFSHLDDESESRKTEIIQSIRSLGEKPRIQLLVHGLANEAEALRIESIAIGLIGLRSLTNEVRGYGTDVVGRIPLSKLVALYTSKPIAIAEPSILIRINKAYRYDMTDDELYEATRGIWKAGVRREKAKFAFAVFRGCVRDVFVIDRWVPAGSTLYRTSVHDNVRVPGRWEFVGRRAGEAIRLKYLDGSVNQYFAQGAQNPITYVNC